MIPEQPIRNGDDIRRDLEKLIEAGTLRPRRFGPAFDRLLATVEHELQVMIAMQALGPIAPSLEQVRQVALMVADQVDWEFQVEPKAQPGEGLASSHDIPER